MSVLLEIASERINQFNIRPYFTPIILNGWKSPLSVRACVKKNPSQKKFLRITPVLLLLLCSLLGNSFWGFYDGHFF